MTTTMQKVIEVAAAEFKVAESELTAESSPDQVKNWDSAAQLRLAMRLEEKFNVSFEIEEFEQMTSIAAISSLIDKKRT